MHRRTLSLLELLIATALLSVVLLSLFGSLFSSDRLRTLTRERTAAGLRAVSMLEEVAASDWDALPGRSGETFEVAVETGNGGWQLEPPAGLPAPGLVTVVDAASPDLRQIRVSVRWSSRAGGESRFEMCTLVARH